ncbi:MAG: hypothetical protein SVP52_04335, partial [Chloroflexota bacterium]|nr:hypothetical protein [Chloroflexota bacterium]
MYNIDPEYLSIYISIFSLIIAILSLPISYLISLKTIRKKLDESEHRENQQAIKRVMESINEFFLIFYSTVEDIVKINRHTFNANPG